VDIPPASAVATPTGTPRTHEAASRAGRGAIEVHLRALNQLFHSMDPSPFHEKALDPDAETFIVSIARERPTEAAPLLVVFLDQLDRSPEELRMVGQAIRVHFARRAEMKRRELRHLLRLGRISLGIALPFLGVSVIVGDLVAGSMGARSIAVVLRESLVIGGWVAMWRPIELLLYDWWPVRNDERLFKRLSRMEVRLVTERHEDVV
jgi:hypothetical protein